MSTQITVRLPDELVAFADALVAAGEARSRASVVERALFRELRRELARRDIERLQAAPGADDLRELAAWSASQPLGLD